jgi:hypothetical protein
MTSRSERALGAATVDLHLQPMPTAELRRFWREHVAPHWPRVHLMVRPGLDCYGMCRERGRDLQVVVRAGLPRCVAIETIIHEIAHATTWYLIGPEADTHGPEWGVAYARAYQVIMGAR